MVKDHSDSEIGNLLPPHGLLFPINRANALTTELRIFATNRKE